MAAVLVLSYDLGGRTLGNQAILRQKLRRDGFGDDDDVTLIAWSNETRVYEHGKGILAIALRARLPYFKPLYDLLFIQKAPDIAVREAPKPARIVVADFSLLWAARATQKRCGGVLEMHLNNLPTDLARTRSALHRAYSTFMERMTLHIPDLFFVINETTRSYLLQRGVPSDRIRLRVPDTIRQDLGLIARTARGRVRARYNISDDQAIVLSVGRLEPEKGFEELLEVFAPVSDRAMLIIVGDGSQREVLHAKCKELGITGKVVMAGKQDRQQLWEFYRDADVFVLLSRSEALGLAFWEAMFMGVPVIGRPIGGIEETIGENGLRGFFWDTSDGAEAFSRTLTRCLERSDDVDAIVSRARSYVEARVGLASAK